MQHNTTALSITSRADLSAALLLICTPDLYSATSMQSRLPGNLGVKPKGQRATDTTEQMVVLYRSDGQIVNSMVKQEALLQTGTPFLVCSSCRFAICWSILTGSCFPGSQAQIFHVTCYPILLTRYASLGPSVHAMVRIQKHTHPRTFTETQES